MKMSAAVFHGMIQRNSAGCRAEKPRSRLCKCSSVSYLQGCACACAGQIHHGYNTPACARAKGPGSMKMRDPRFEFTRFVIHVDAQTVGCTCVRAAALCHNGSAMACVCMELEVAE